LYFFNTSECPLIDIIYQFDIGEIYITQEMIKPPKVPPIIAISPVVRPSPTLSPDTREAVNKPKPAAQAISTHAVPD
jgi:hypothetical protein